MLQNLQHLLHGCSQYRVTSDGDVQADTKPLPLEHPRRLGTHPSTPRDDANITFRENPLGPVAANWTQLQSSTRLDESNSVGTHDSRPLRLCSRDNFHGILLRDSLCYDENQRHARFHGLETCVPHKRSRDVDQRDIRPVLLDGFTHGIIDRDGLHRPPTLARAHSSDDPSPILEHVLSHCCCLDACYPLNQNPTVLQDGIERCKRSIQYSSFSQRLIGPPHPWSSPLRGIQNRRSLPPPSRIRRSVRRVVSRQEIFSCPSGTLSELS